MNQETEIKSRIAVEAEARDQAIKDRVAEEIAPLLHKAIEAENLQSPYKDQDETGQAKQENVFDGSYKDHPETVAAREFDEAVREANKLAEAADYRTLAKGVGDLKRAELKKGINPEHVLTSEYLEPGLIADFVIEDPDTKEKSKKPVLVIGIEDGQVDFIGIDRQKSDFGHAYKKSFAEIGLGSGEDQEAIQTLDPTTHATSKGLRIPPKYHDKTEAENQLALLKRINQSMGTKEPNTSIEGIANEALAIWTVNQQNAEQANVPDNVHSIAEAQTKPVEKIAA